MLATKSGASLDACSKLVSLVMGIGGDCGVPKNQLVSSCTPVLLVLAVCQMRAACCTAWQRLVVITATNLSTPCAGGVRFQRDMGWRQASCRVLHQLILLGPRH